MALKRATLAIPVPHSMGNGMGLPRMWQSAWSTQRRRESLTSLRVTCCSGAATAATERALNEAGLECLRCLLAACMLNVRRPRVYMCLMFIHCQNADLSCNTDKYPEYTKYWDVLLIVRL
jgi:hypothetical protein